MAEPFLWGSPFSLPSGIQFPRMTALGNGTFLFIGKTGTIPDLKLNAWIYNADGSLKAEQILDVPDPGPRRTNDTLDLLAIDPMAVELPDGKIAVTWTVNTPGSGGLYVAPWVCIYDADLKPIGVPRPVFGTNEGDRDSAETMVALADGTLVISGRNEQDGHAYLRVLSPDGTRSPALDLGTAGGNVFDTIVTDLAALSDGKVAVVVQTNTSTLTGYVLTPSGAGGPALSKSFEISTSTSPQKGAVKVTALKDGGFVVTWMEKGSAANPDYNTFFRIYRPDGTVSDVKSVSPTPFPDPFSAGHSDVLALLGGGFALAYEKATYVTGEPEYEVHLAVFDKNGTRLTDDVRVSPAATTNSIYLHELHLMADGRILVRHSQGIQIVDPRSEGVSLNGTAGNDHYIGTGFNDTFDGGAGADILNGAGGIDFVSFASSGIGVTASLAGASGDGAGDTWISIEGIIGSSYADTLIGNGSAIFKGRGGDDTYHIRAGDILEEAANEGRDTVIVGGSYALSLDAEIEVLKLSGVSSKRSANLTGSNTANEITGHTGKNTLMGQGGNDVLKASSGNDVLYGGSGSDKLSGGAGNDRLYGGTGTGRDVFVFDSKPNKTSNVDRIYDFNPKYDSIQLENKIFTKLGEDSTKGVKFKADMFVKGDAAKDQEDRIIYDNKTGALYYDQDGTGSKAQVKIATLSKDLKLTHHDFFVV